MGLSEILMLIIWPGLLIIFGPPLLVRVWRTFSVVQEQKKTNDARLTEIEAALARIEKRLSE